MLLGLGKGIWVNQHENPVFSPFVLIFNAPLALFIGVFVQILWEKEPLTEPI